MTDIVMMEQNMFRNAQLVSLPIVSDNGAIEYLFLCLTLIKTSKDVHSFI